MLTAHFSVYRCGHYLDEQPVSYFSRFYQG